MVATIVPSATVGIVPETGAALIIEAPLATAVPLNVWLLPPLAPTTLNVPPPSRSAEIFDVILVLGAPTAEKSSFNVPLLIVVLPV